MLSILVHFSPSRLYNFLMINEVYSIMVQKAKHLKMEICDCLLAER